MPVQAVVRHLRVPREQVERVVATSDKRRFALDGESIRANQGHSVAVDLELQPVEPPPLLFHGTPERNVEAILREGLRRGARHHVHLSAEARTATAVGARTHPDAGARANTGR